MKIKFWQFIFVMMCIVVVPVAMAQESCPVIVQQALESTEGTCEALGRNQICYGNVILDVEFQEDAQNIDFASPGDIANVSAIKTLQLSSLNETDVIWGIALMKLQANIPGSLPGQNVTFLLFGDVQMENRVIDVPTVDLQATQRINVRLRPTSNGTLAGSLQPGDTITASGIYTNSAGETWVRVSYEDGRTGWIINWGLSSDGQEMLEEVGADEAFYAPMQAFYFQSGVGDAACAESPESGILMQTPKGVGQVNFSINGVDVNLGSTAFIQAEPGGFLYVNTLEGSVQITANGLTRTIPPGTRSRVELDDDGNAIGTPTFPEPYEMETIQTLPVTIILPDAVEIIEPQTPQVTQPSTGSSGSIGGGDSGSSDGGAQAPANSGGGDPVSGSAGDCSVAGDTSVNITFVNNSGRTVSVYWVDYNCQEVYYSTLAPGESYIQQTFVTHPWVVRDDSGAQRIRFTTTGSATVSIP